jgi:L-lactate dehydrogenase complex protein LldF
MHTTSRQFASASSAAVADRQLQAALDRLIATFPPRRRATLAAVPDFETLRGRASAVRDASLANLATHLETFETAVQRQGGIVHWARDADEACRIVSDLCRAAAATEVVKSKSMVTEEIELNRHLEAVGIHATETDLGEYIVQLRHEPPSHILVPAIHLGRGQIADTFRAEHAGLDSRRDLTSRAALVAEARAVLREQFARARVGITGANFLVADSGSIVLVSNEGNADLVASMPDVHIVVTGIEKVVAGLEEVGTLLEVLARSATGQDCSTYTTILSGGPVGTPGRQRHVVLVDNGRSALLGTPMQPMLRCIRCSACLSHCPVYAASGGHSYGSVYSGPMGAVLTPALAGLEAARALPNASTLCGRCAEVCPVRIPLPQLLRHWREQEFARHLTPRGTRVGLAAWAWLAQRPRWYRALMRPGRFALRLLARRGWITRLPPPFAAWTRRRDLPAPARRSFQDQWRGARR